MSPISDHWIWISGTHDGHARLQPDLDWVDKTTEAAELDRLQVHAVAG
jgi:hypothetical protein